MPVEDVFTITGRGTVITGRIERGIVKVDEEVEIVGIREASQKSTVTGVEMFRKLLGVAALVAAPIVREGRLVAVLCAATRSPRTWRPADVALVAETAERTYTAAERAQGEQALRANEERMRLALTAAGIGLFVWNVAEHRGEPIRRCCPCSIRHRAKASIRRRPSPGGFTPTIAHAISRPSFAPAIRPAAARSTKRFGSCVPTAPCAGCWSRDDTRDVISMPDKWEYPWYASWDLAFQTLPMAMVDPDFAKRQLLLLTRDWYMHPNAQLPAYEYSFSDANPPVHAWAAWRVYLMDRAQTGRGTGSSSPASFIA